MDALVKAAAPRRRITGCSLRLATRDFCQARVESGSGVTRHARHPPRDPGTGTPTVRVCGQYRLRQDLGTEPQVVTQ